MNDLKDSKFYLHIGCHRGTLMSRDSDNPSPFDTYDEAYQNYLEAKASWKRFGLMVWFANIVSPDGTKTNLESNPYY